MKPQLSLFENSNCTQCGAEIEEGFIYCNDCAEAWVEKYLNPEQLEK
jgi:predicted amidophosphoribosyltransferase